MLLPAFVLAMLRLSVLGGISRRALRSGVAGHLAAVRASAMGARFASDFPPHSIVTMPPFGSFNGIKMVSWHVSAGDAISSGDTIATVETYKANMIVEAQYDAIVAKLLVEEGTSSIPGGTPIAVVVKRGEDVSSFSSFTVEDAKGDEPEEEAATEKL